MKRIYVAALLALFSTTASADMADDLEDLVGYTILGVKTIDGWYDENGKKGDSFEGCEHGRTIVFSDNRTLECAEYHYHYSYRPRAVIISDGSSFKMVVDDDVYDMRR